MKKFKLAICQNRPLKNKTASVTRALEMIEKAVGKGASLVILPEMFYISYDLKNIRLAAEKRHETLEILKRKAISESVYICTGSTAEIEGGKIYNKSHLISPLGEILLEYSKCHLFDVSLKKLNVRESSVISPGTRITSVETPLGRIGILICYDIRFPEAARKLALEGTELLIVPAAFNTITGPAHWHTVFRARAIENQFYVAAASPARDETAVYKAYGHSLIATPWGNILNEAGSEEEIITAEINPKDIIETRAKLPLMKHRRKELYGND
jgi:predicted amidohydrolase